MINVLHLSLSLLALISACTEEVGLLDEDTNFGGRGGEPLETVMDILDRAPPPTQSASQCLLRRFACAH